MKFWIPEPNVIELGEVTIKGKTKKPFRDKYLGQLDSLAKIDLSSVWVCCHGYLENFKDGYSHECNKCGDSIRVKPVDGGIYAIIKYDYVEGNREKVLVDVVRAFEFHYPKLTEEELLKMNNLYKIKAYYGKREFYQPNYDKEKGNDFIPDSRNTLLWAPSVVTDKNGEAILEFFCSDINSQFVGKVEGVSSEGLLGTNDFEFKVLKTKPYSWEK